MIEPSVGDTTTKGQNPENSGQNPENSGQNPENSGQIPENSAHDGNISFVFNC